MAKNWNWRAWRDTALANDIDYNCYLSRVKHLGWTAERAATTPKKIERKKSASKPSGWTEWKTTALANGIDYNRFLQRVRAGWSVKQAANIPKQGLTADELAMIEKLGITKKQFWQRLSNGWTRERAASTPLVKKTNWTEWREVAIANGINKRAFNVRVSRGMDVEQAATMPLQKRKKGVGV